MVDAFIKMLIGLISATLAASVQRPAIQPTDWPEIPEFTRSVVIQVDASRIDVDIPLSDVNGIIRYRLICRGGSEAYLDYVSERAGVSGYTPWLTCILNVGNQETDGSLLSEDESSAYFSRGHFSRRDLMGACGRYPEYGLTRHFRLRGMELELSFSDLTRGRGPGLATDEPDSALLNISVRRDPSAQTAKAEQPGYLRPSGTVGSCRTVQRGNSQRMCRNAVTSAWMQCPAGWENRRYQWENNAPGKIEPVEN